MKPKYIDVCRGEIRIGFVEYQLTSLSGGPEDPDQRKFAALCGLREMFADLNRRLEDCIAATGALALWEPK